MRNLELRFYPAKPIKLVDADTNETIEEFGRIGKTAHAVLNGKDKARRGILKSTALLTIYSLSLGVAAASIDYAFAVAIGAIITPHEVLKLKKATEEQNYYSRILKAFPHSLDLNETSRTRFPFSLRHLTP